MPLNLVRIDPKTKAVAAQRIGAGLIFLRAAESVDSAAVRVLGARESVCARSTAIPPVTAWPRCRRFRVCRIWNRYLPPSLCASTSPLSGFAIASAKSACMGYRVTDLEVNRTPARPWPVGLLSRRPENSSYNTLLTTSLSERSSMFILQFWKRYVREFVTPAPSWKVKSPVYI